MHLYQYKRVFMPQDKKESFLDAQRAARLLGKTYIILNERGYLELGDRAMPGNLKKRNSTNNNFDVYLQCPNVVVTYEK